MTPGLSLYGYLLRLTCKRRLVDAVRVTLQVGGRPAFLWNKNYILMLSVYIITKMLAISLFYCLQYYYFKDFIIKNSAGKQVSGNVVVKQRCAAILLYYSAYRSKIFSEI